jgi:histidine kinase
LVQQDHGFCVAGRFDQLSQNQKPYDAFVETFSSYVEMLIKRDDRKIGADLSKIEGIDLLLKMIPALRRLIPQVEQPDETTSKDASCDFDFQNASLRDASNLSKIVLRLFLRTIASKGRPPLVIALEHLHWADEAALDVLLSLLSDSVHQRILFVATEREDLSTPALATMLQRIHVNEVTLTHIHLLNMDEEATTQFVTHMLAVDPDVAESLASAVFPSTRGNRYFTRVLLQNLARKGVLKCNDASGRHKWSWDTDEIRRECQTSMEDTLQARLLELPNSVMRLLRYASFLGFRLNTEILSYLMEERIDSYLQVAEDGGLVARSGSHGWEFTNETVQDAAFGLVPNDERELFHLRIGRRLWKHFDLKKLDKHIFIVVEELLAGERLVTDARERVAIAKLCLRAAEQSVHMSSFQTAYYYYERGIALLGPKRWEENYELTLELYDHAVEVAFCIGKFTELYKLVDDVVLHAHCFSDTLRSHATKIFALGTNLKTRQAMAHALEILSQLDVCFPKKPSLIRTVFECQRLRRRLKRKSSQSLQRIPFLKDESKLIAMRILCQFVFEALLLDDPVAPLIIFRMVSFSLDHGICAMSSLGFALFGALLCGYVECRLDVLAEYGV